MAKAPETAFDFDVTKIFGDYKMPVFDISALVSTQRKNIEAVTQANRVAYEGFQAIFRRQMEIMRQAVEELSDVSKMVAEPGTPQDKMAKHTEVAKEAFERGLGNMREIMEMMTRSNNDSMDLLNKRFMASLDEVRDLMLKNK